MNKIITIAVFIFILLMFFQISTGSSVKADWWIRPTAQPTQPSFDRNLEPTTVVHPTVAPTSEPVQPTVTPGTVPTNPPSQGGTGSPDGGGSSNNNPCAAGQSYVGPYCGWSPDVNHSGGGGGGSSESPRIGGPQVLGLSNTSSSDVAFSDIMILAGVLCLLVYTRSKITTNSQSH
ncbi:hypothetical protein HY029_03390 [Candidatus Gottesmanbacteria bacterium]|nr:hypothetical protein [Candidatus Gottesmanbacteria bacterium]